MAVLHHGPEKDKIIQLQLYKYKIQTKVVKNSLIKMLFIKAQSF